MARPTLTGKIANVGVNALARECGVTATTISQRMKRGQTADEIRAVYAQRKGLPPKKGTDGVGRAPSTPSEYEMILAGRERLDQMQTYKLRKEKALAERQELENMLKRGELVPVTYVREWASRFLIEARDELLKGPGELADALAAEEDPHKAAVILRSWVDRVIAKYYGLDRMWGKESERNYAGIAS